MKFFLLLLSVSFLGCASVNVPNYISDVHPYKKTYYGDFDKIVQATEKTIDEYGWDVTEHADPSVFERSAVTDSYMTKQVLLFTRVREMSLFVGSRYSRLNAYVRSTADKTNEVEFRYVTVSSMSVKNFYNYRKDHLIDRMFKRIEELTK